MALRRGSRPAPAGWPGIVALEKELVRRETSCGRRSVVGCCDDLVDQQHRRAVREWRLRSASRLMGQSPVARVWRRVASADSARTGVHVVGHDHAVVDRAQPARHDDAHAAGMVQAADLLRQAAADGQALRTWCRSWPRPRAGCSAGTCSGVAASTWSSRSRMFGHVLLQRVQRRFDQVALAGLVLLRGQSGPVLVAGVRAGHDQAARPPLGRVRG